MMIRRRAEPMRPRYGDGKWFFPYGRRTDPTRTRQARRESLARRQRGRQLARHIP